MPYIIPIDQARIDFPEYDFINALTPSEQKAAFQVVDQDGRHLCLKIIKPNSDIVYLQREVLALSSLSHPNVVQLIEYTHSTKKGILRHFIVEEFIDGCDLSDLLSKPNYWTIDKLSIFFEALFRGIHEVGLIDVVHRDLKPSNIRVRFNGSPVIIDFGLSRHLNLQDITRTSEGAQIGTPLYFSPEQFLGTKYDIDHRTDLFALGIILYTAAVGHHPFYSNGISYSEFKDATCTSNQHYLDSDFIKLPPGWKLVIQKLLEKERANRPLNGKLVADIIIKLRGDT